MDNEIKTPIAGTSDASIYPVVEERMVIGTEVRETGMVRIIKQVQVEDPTLDTTLAQESIKVERVSMHVYVDAKNPPQICVEGDTTVIPVLMEVV